MRIAFAGTPAVAIPTLKALLDSSHEVVAVISQPPAMRGRSKQLVASDVAQFAQTQGIDVFTPDSINNFESIAYLKSLKVDVAIVVAYGQLLKKETLEVFPLGWINAHFSLLPAWRGAAPAQAALIHGDEVTGVTTFQLETGMDSGPVFGQVTTEIEEFETAGELLNRLSLMGADLVLKTLEVIATGQAKPTPQVETDVSYAHKLSSAQGQITWTHPALAISRHIRGFTPEPGAWTRINGSRIQIGPVEITSNLELNPGQLRIEKSAIYVGTGSSEIKLGQVKPEGKSWMEASAWARGLRELGDFENA